MTTLHALRTAADLSQQALAAVLGVTQSYLSNMECGKVRCSARVVRELQSLYGWVIRPQQPRTASGRRRMFRPHLPNPEAKRILLMKAACAMCAYQGEWPKDWRDDVGLYRKALREYEAQEREGRLAG